MGSFSFVVIEAFLWGAKKARKNPQAIWVAAFYRQSPLVVEFDAHKKPKQREGYLGSGGFSESWTKKCPDDQGDQRGLKCTIIASYGGGGYLALYWILPSEYTG